MCNDDRSKNSNPVIDDETANLFYFTRKTIADPVNVLQIFVALVQRFQNRTNRCSNNCLSVCGFLLVIGKLSIMFARRSITRGKQLLTTTCAS